MLEFARGPNRSGITTTLDVGHISLNLTGQLEVTGIESNYSSDRKAATEKVSGLSEPRPSVNNGLNIEPKSFLWLPREGALVSSCDAQGSHCTPACSP